MIHRELDQFFTKKETAKKCLDFLLPYLDISNLSWIEPSAGSGIFINAAIDAGFPKISAAYDLMPQTEDVITADYLTVDLTKVFKENTQRLCLGNPPFGKNSSLAVKFFNHSAKNCDFIAMIFPATFSKESLHKRLDKSFELIAELDLGNTPFTFVKETRLVPVVFQIWKKTEILRVKEKSKLVSECFSFVSREEADFAIQRVGYAAGRVKLDLTKIASASHYFIKSNLINSKEVFEKINWKSIKNKTAGNPSIAKTELIREFEKLIKEII